jgi:glucose-1-phosphate thymidylyltransferase
MKVLIPAAGQGVRLKPHTLTRPKPMIYVAGKPIIGHILDNLKGLFDEIVIIVGYMKDKLIKYVDTNFSDHFTIQYVEQEEMQGLGHAVYMGKEKIGSSSMLITLGDEFFGMTYEEMLDEHKKLLPAACTLGVKHVQNPSHYGVVEEVSGKVSKLEEKPEHPSTDLAIAGVYLVEDTNLLWECLEKVMQTGNKNASGETSLVNYQLTDALQLMVEAGAELKTFTVPEWYDCGRPEMLLEVNQLLLDKYSSNNQGVMRRCVLIDPIQIGENCKLEDSIIGPHVSIAQGTVIQNSIIKNTIIGSDAEIKNMVLSASIINDEVVMHGRGQTVNVGENSEIKMI